MAGIARWLQHRFGLLTPNTVTGDVLANLGTMPSVVHPNMNLSSAFTLNPKDKETSAYSYVQRTQCHLAESYQRQFREYTPISRSIGQPVAAEAAQRVEPGLRLAFLKAQTEQ
jgi:hypothetical protein